MIDYLLKYASQSAAQSALPAHVSGGAWRQDHVEPNVTVMQISTATPLSGWFCVVSLTQRDSTIEASSALQIALDRGEAIGSRSYVLAHNLGSLLTDIKTTFFDGSMYASTGFDAHPAATSIVLTDDDGNAFEDNLNWITAG